MCPPRNPAPPDEIYDLWHRMAGFSAAETDVALQHLMQWIATRIEADNVTWIGAIRVLTGESAKADAFQGWRLRARHPLNPDPPAYRKLLSSYLLSEHYGKLTPTYYRRSHDAMKEAHIGATTRALLAGAGRFRVHRLRDGWIDYAAFRRSLHHRLYYRDLGIADRIWVSVPVSTQTESLFLIDRIRGPGTIRRPFTGAAAFLAGNALRGLPDFHRRLLLSSGLLTSDKPLSPTESQILQGLLTSRTEKEIALSVGQKPATLHKYVTALYTRFGVKSRAALMALWLGGK